MFDLKYYNELSKPKKYFDEFKGNVFSRQNIHKFDSMKQKDVIPNLIDDLPDYQLKNIIKVLYEQDGINGLTKIGKVINKIQMNRSQA